MPNQISIWFIHEQCFGVYTIRILWSYVKKIYSYKTDSDWSSGEIESTLEEISLRAVTYTHLDVYKRQVCGNIRNKRQNCGVSAWKNKKHRKKESWYYVWKKSIYEENLSGRYERRNRSVLAVWGTGTVSYTHQMCIRDRIQWATTKYRWYFTKGFDR